MYFNTIYYLFFGSMNLNLDTVLLCWWVVVTVATTNTAFPNNDDRRRQQIWPWPAVVMVEVLLVGRKLLRCCPTISHGHY